MLKFLLKSVIWAAEASYNTPERKGARGETKVDSALSSVLDSENYRVFADVVLPTSDGTTQVDHIVLSRFGIFVIETKNMSGWIFGDMYQKKWTQVQKRFKRQFQNPLRQNYGHVKAVQEALGVREENCHNLVVFVGSAIPKTQMPVNVAWGLRELGLRISQHKNCVFSKVEVEELSQSLSSRSIESTKSVRRQHLMNVKEKAVRKKTVPQPGLAALSRPTCPRCKAEMVTRKNRKTGSTFWGCSKFPECRATKKIN